MARQTVDPPPIRERRLRMSYEEFLAWADEDTHAEWVDGEVTVFMPVTLEHQLLLGFLYELLSTFARLFRLGDVLLGPAQMRLVAERSARAPDLFFLAAAHRGRRTRLGIEGPADLVIEIVSDDSVRRDQIDRREEYAAAGVSEYWWLDPRPGHRDFRFFRLTDEGSYAEIEPDAAGRYHSAVLRGFWLDPNWLWQDPLPDPTRLVAEIAPHAWRDYVRRLEAPSDVE